MAFTLMETSDLPRQQIVKRHMALPTEKVADAAINLWEQMATQITSIVGEDGFNSLYTHSILHPVHISLACGCLTVTTN